METQQIVTLQDAVNLWTAKAIEAENQDRERREQQKAETEKHTREALAESVLLPIMSMDQAHFATWTGGPLNY